MVDDLADKTLYNEMDDIAEFIQRWDDENHPVNRSNPTILTSLLGNINDNGQAGLYRSAELSPHQRDFVESIEEGVRDLVLAIADENGWITYCSCAGHRYPNTTIPPATSRCWRRADWSTGSGKEAI